MRFLVTSLLAFAFASLLALAPDYRAAAQEDTLDVIVHPTSPIARLSSAEVEAIFTRSMTRWSDGSSLIPLNLPTGSAERNRFDSVVLRLSPDEVTRFWFDRRVRGMGLPPKQVRDGALMLGVVSNLKGSVGYLPSSASRGAVKVVARVAQGKVVPP